MCKGEERCVWDSYVFSKRHIILSFLTFFPITWLNLPYHSHAEIPAIALEDPHLSFFVCFKKKKKVADDVCIAIREREREKKMTYRQRQRQGRRYRHADCWEGSVQWLSIVNRTSKDICCGDGSSSEENTRKGIVKKKKKERKGETNTTAEK